MITAADDTVARELLSAARALVNTSAPDTRGLWPRAAALLSRQALEVALKTYWSFVAPGAEDASMRAQLLSLDGYLSPAIARDAYQAWSALSRASHHHVYELAPTRDELLAWCEAVEGVISETERAWRR
jgi:hypothetical protein